MMSCAHPAVPQRAVSRVRSIAIPVFLVTLAAAGAFWGASPEAQANVTPEVLLRFHVQDVPDPSFCQTNPITSCGQLRRTSYDEGTMEFDLFLHPMTIEGEHLPLHSIDANLLWPSTWHVVGFEPCSGGQGSLQQNAGGGRMLLQFPEDPALPDSLFLIARFTVEVTGQGALNSLYPAFVTVGNEPDVTVRPIVATMFADRVPLVFAS